MKYPEQRRLSARDREFFAGVILRESIADRLRREVTKHSQLSCPLCSRDGLADDRAFWNHLSMRHTPNEIASSIVDRRVMSDHVESELVRIVNSDTLEDAIEIATQLLLGE